MKTLSKKELDEESGKFDIEREKLMPSTRPVQKNNQALLSGLSYCLSSCSMILVNKCVLSSYDFNAGISLMLYQVISLFLMCPYVFITSVYHEYSVCLNHVYMFAELYFGIYCVYAEYSWCNIDRGIDMETDQGVVTC